MSVRVTIKRLNFNSSGNDELMLDAQSGENPNHELWYPLELNRFAEPNIRLDLLYSSVVMGIHCSEVSWARGSSPAMLLMLTGRKRTVETSRSLRWSRTSGCGYYKEHIIPVFSRVAPFRRDYPFPIHSHLPIKAVQFTILSIIAIGYKSAFAP